MSNLPDWYHEAKAEGRITEKTLLVDNVIKAISASADFVAESMRGISEAIFQKNVMDLAKTYGWRRAHFRKVRAVRKNGQQYWETPVAGDAKGFLDLELVRERLIKVELKVRPNKMTKEQNEWFDAYCKASIECYCWYPEDWSQIIKVLR